MMKLLCLGDSNTYGYDPRSHFGSRYPISIRWTEHINGWTVLNHGVNGLTVPTEIKFWRDLIERSNPDLVVVMLGSNDLLECRLADEIARRMEIFLQEISYIGMTILLIAPPILKQGEWVQKEAQIHEAIQLSRLYKVLADKIGVDFADAEEWGIELSFDGVHFTENGHKAFAIKLEKYLEKYTNIESSFKILSNAINRKAN